MKLSIIPYNSYFRIIDINGTHVGPVYFKPNIESFSPTHIGVTDITKELKYFPKDTEVDILDKSSNF